LILATEGEEQSCRPAQATFRIIAKMTDDVVQSIDGDCLADESKAMRSIFEQVFR
jgi:hypothetical protein